MRAPIQLPAPFASQSYVGETQGDEPERAETWIIPAAGGDQGDPSQDESPHHQADTADAGTWMLGDSAMRQLSTGIQPKPLPMLVPDDHFQLQAVSSTENWRLEQDRHPPGDMIRSEQRRVTNPTPPYVEEGRSALKNRCSRPEHLGR